MAEVTISNLMRATAVDAADMVENAKTTRLAALTTLSTLRVTAVRLRSGLRMAYNMQRSSTTLTTLYPGFNDLMEEMEAALSMADAGLEAGSQVETGTADMLTAILALEAITRVICEPDLVDGDVRVSDDVMAELVTPPQSPRISRAPGAPDRRVTRSMRQV